MVHRRWHVIGGYRGVYHLTIPLLIRILALPFAALTPGGSKPASGWQRVGLHSPMPYLTLGSPQSGSPSLLAPRSHVLLMRRRRQQR